MRFFILNFRVQSFFYRCGKFSNEATLTLNGKFALEREYRNNKVLFVRFALHATWLELECFMVSRLCIVSCFFSPHYLLSFVVCFPNIFPTRAFSNLSQWARAAQQEHFSLFHLAVSHSVVGVLRNCFFVYCDCFTTTIAALERDKANKMDDVLLDSRLNNCEQYQEISLVFRIVSVAARRNRKNLLRHLAHRTCHTRAGRCSEATIFCHRKNYFKVKGKFNFDSKSSAKFSQLTVASCLLNNKINAVNLRLPLSSICLASHSLSSSSVTSVCWWFFQFFDAVKSS